MDVVANLKRGSHSTFKQVYDEYHERIYFYILGKSGSKYMAEEVLQSTFFKLWQYRETLTEELPVAAQLFRIANTTFINLLYKAGNERKALSAYGSQVSDSAVNDTLLRVSGNETEQHIQRAIHAMPPVRRKVFELSRYQGMSYSQIASELSISIRTVESHISKALQQLRRLTTLFPPVTILFPLILAALTHQ
jgi:RNA polymerase sigma-70 factor (family 1)